MPIRGPRPSGAGLAFAESGHTPDTTATEPLQISGLVKSGHRDIEHNNGTPEHPQNTTLHLKSAPGVQRECATSDPDLAQIIDAWPDLPASVRAEILRMAGMTKEQG